MPGRVFYGAPPPLPANRVRGLVGLTTAIRGGTEPGPDTPTGVCERQTRAWRREKNFKEIRKIP
ncbi:hypothetical protein TPY_1616 [Sulfobacillus acidophilus TPY]|nr:hypothetical protein TPY_1616 [Sulfobacillus acidophilus TPY]